MGLRPPHRGGPGGEHGTVPTREWLYYYWKDNAHQGQNWCKYGRENGSYIQQIEWDDCRSGNFWTPGQSVIASIGQGYVSVTPLQLASAYAALANGGTLYSPRIGEALVSPTGKVDQKITPPVLGHLPGRTSTLAYIRQRAGRRGHPGHGPGHLRRVPAGPVCVAGKTGTAQVGGNQATSVFASFAPCDHPKYVVVVMIPNSGYGADVSGPGGPADLGRDLRARRPQGGAARRRCRGRRGPEPVAGQARRPAGADPAAARPPAGKRRATRRRHGAPGPAMSRVERAAKRPGRPPGRRPAQRRRGLAPGAGRDSALPPGGLDCLLAAVLALSLIGTLLVWSATEPVLKAAGRQPARYLMKQLLNIAIGLVLMLVVARSTTGQLRMFAPVLYGLSCLGLLVVLTPLGSIVNGANSWISLPGGFQIEPSEYAKLSIIVMQRDAAGRVRQGEQRRAAARPRPWRSPGRPCRSLLVAAEPDLGVII